MSTKIIYKIDFEKELNYQQYKIVKEAEKPCIVLAGPGSGKTKVLVYRVCYLLENGVPPSSILLLTFTNKAAKEMIERVKRILGYYPKNLWAGTFHHIGNLILRIYGKNVGISPNFTILDEEDSIQLIKEVSNRFSEIDEFPPPAKLKEIISFS
ncbi:MAG: ATP-dependent helicase, partial [Candidatus Omnitrophota bacterium]